MAKSRPQRPQQPQEFESGASPAPDAIEFDPDHPESAQVAETPAAAAEDALIEPSDDLFAARDELIEALGGVETFAAAAEGFGTPGSLGLENIMGVGVGFKQTADGYTGDLAVKVFVREKVPASRLAAEALVPQEVAGYATDVEAIGEIRAQVYNRRYPRPVPCGVSCGHFRITAGTLGCLVVLNNNRLCILSNNHVLANENNASIGDNILQPGRLDGGMNPADRIGVLERFVRINFSGTNRVDAAAAWTSNSLVSPRHVTYSLNPSPMAPTLGLAVMKNGRTTQSTMGTITAVGVNGVNVAYSGGTARFDNQVVIRGIGSASFSRPGDSGSLIVGTATRRPVGLLFAGSATHTIANPIAAVIAELGISRFIGG